MAKLSKLHLAGVLALCFVPMLPGCAGLFLLLHEAALLPGLRDARVFPLWDEAKFLAVLDGRPAAAAFIAFAFVCGAYFAGVTLKQILFHRGRGLWVGQGRLRYFGAGVRSISLRHVREVSLDRENTGNAGGEAHPAIALRLKSGEIKRIPTRHFREPPEIVAAALAFQAKPLKWSTPRPAMSP